MFILDDLQQSSNGAGPAEEQAEMVSGEQHGASAKYAERPKGMEQVSGKQEEPPDTPVTRRHGPGLAPASEWVAGSLH